MQPIGLTTKRSRNKYARGRDGELMLTHRCIGCGTVVINRIAADDSSAAIVELCDGLSFTSAELRAELAASGVAILTMEDGDLVHKRLFGDRPVNVRRSCVTLVEQLC